MKRPEIDKGLDLTLVCGFSRSGTTWLAKILETVTSVKLVSEPDKRSNRHLKFSKVIHSCEPDNVGMKQLYRLAMQELMRIEDFNLNSVPLFKKTYYNVPFFCYRSLFYFFKIVNKVLNPFSAKCIFLPFSITKKDKIDVVWKSVSQSTNINFLRSTFPGIRFVYILRNPYDSIGSALRKDTMAIDGKDERRLRERKHTSFLKDNHEYSKAKISSLSEVQKRTLLWRVETETAISQGQNHDDFYFLLYEDLAQNTMEEISSLFAWLGWPVSDTTVEFIKRSTGIKEKSVLEQIFSFSYFGVFRKKNQLHINSSKDMQKEVVEDIRSIVKDSFLMKYW